MTSGIKVATKTVDLINKTMEADQGASFRKALEPLLPKMDDAYRGEGKPFRPHLGASLIGRDCTQELWLSYHWATTKNFPAKVLRLFNRGHLEEARFLALLQIINVDVWYETEEGGQIRFSDIYGHFGSALDGIGRNIPDLPPDVPAYLEFKTHGEKSFNKVKKNGVRNEKMEHFAQVQICMHEMKLPTTLYMAVNKNTDELYAEIIDYDQEVAVKYLQRAEAIIFSIDGMSKIGSSVSWYQCRFCDQKKVCHGSTAPEINCRTCAHSAPTNTGEWTCARGYSNIQTDEAFVGCSQHVYNPYMLNKVQYHGGSAEQNCIDITLQDGERILHGPNHITSQQLKERGL